MVALMTWILEWRHESNMPASTGAKNPRAQSGDTGLLELDYWNGLELDYWEQ